MPSDVVDIYNTATGEWSVAHLSQPRAGVAIYTVGTKVLFLGGYTDRYGHTHANTDCNCDGDGNCHHNGDTNSDRYGHSYPHRDRDGYTDGDSDRNTDADTHGDGDGHRYADTYAQPNVRARQREWHC